MNRAFIKEDDGERTDALADMRSREERAEWLRIQRKKLDTLLNMKSGKADPETLARWIRQTQEDIAQMEAR